MNRDEPVELYRISWTQHYVNWEPVEPELDLTQAREVLARIMAL